MLAFQGSEAKCICPWAGPRSTGKWAVVEKSCLVHVDVVVTWNLWAEWDVSSSGNGA